MHRAILFAFLLISFSLIVFGQDTPPASYEFSCPDGTILRITFVPVRSTQEYDLYKGTDYVAHVREETFLEPKFECIKPPAPVEKPAEKPKENPRKSNKWDGLRANYRNFG